MVYNYWLVATLSAKEVGKVGVESSSFIEPIATPTVGWHQSHVFETRTGKFACTIIDYR